MNESVNEIGTVGFIGLGAIGKPMASHLVDWPGGLYVYDVRAEAMTSLVDDGANAASGARDIAAVCDLVSVMVLDDDQVREVVTALLAVDRPGQIVAVHSTIRPDTAEDLAEVAQGAGRALLDVPVSGSTVGAHQGTLAAIVGGDRAAYERARPVFERWSTLSVHMGPAGAGTRAKLARNVVHYAAFTAVGEAARLAEAAGLDLRKLGRVVRHSDSVTGGPGSVMIRDTAAPMAPDDELFAVLDHARQLGEKDLALALELADDLGVTMPLTRLTLDELGPALGVEDRSHLSP